MKSLLVSVIILAISIFLTTSARHIPDPRAIMNDLDAIETFDDNGMHVDPQLFNNFLRVFRNKFLPKEAFNTEYYED